MNGRRIRLHAEDEGDCICSAVLVEGTTDKYKYKMWTQNGVPHREDAPAFILPNRTGVWYYKGKSVGSAEGYAKMRDEEARIEEGGRRKKSARSTKD